MATYLSSRCHEFSATLWDMRSHQWTAEKSLLFSCGKLPRAPRYQHFSPFIQLSRWFSYENLRWLQGFPSQPHHFHHVSAPLLAGTGWVPGVPGLQPHVVFVEDLGSSHGQSWYAPQPGGHLKPRSSGWLEKPWTHVKYIYIHIIIWYIWYIYIYICVYIYIYIYIYIWNLYR